VRIDVNVDATALLDRLHNADKRISYAVVNAINATAKTIQRAEQLEAQDEFTIRKPAFMLRQVAIIKPFASVSQGRAYAEIAVGQKRRLLLSQFEVGGVREPFKGKSVAVPVEARPSKQASVPEALWIQRLKFRRPKATTAATRRGRRLGVVGKVWEGLNGTYLIPGAGIFQRVGTGVSRVLYVFAQHVKLPKRLHFYATAERIGRRVFAKNLRAEVTAALEFKR
jgi:hypothetical protein